MRFTTILRSILPRVQRGIPSRKRLANVGKVLAISSAKGGVGKSTISANIAIALARLNHRVGVLDADIFGPSIPTLFNIREKPRISNDNRLIPLVNYGVKTMSIGYMVDSGSPIVWRGLMVMKSIQQLLYDVDWDGIDVLVIDLPPGTGDVQLTITQQIFIDGAIIVSTPQRLSTNDVIRGIGMFKKVNTPVLGVIQNMSIFECPHCNKTTRIFGSGDELNSINKNISDGTILEKECYTLSLPILTHIPLNPQICVDADRGKPSVAADPHSSYSKIFEDLASKIMKAIQ